MALIDDVQNLVLFSFSLTPERKNEIIARLPELSEEQLTQLKGVFEEEEKRKNAIIQKAVKKNPELASKIEFMVKNNMQELYDQLESAEKPLEEAQLDEILGKLDNT